jgi:hypothetical protein
MSASLIDLCTVADVKQELEITGDTSRDATIQAVITGTSRAIHTMTERQFRCEDTPDEDGNITYSFRMNSNSYLIDLSPYDLGDTTNTTVTLHPGQPEELELANTLWVGEPIGAKWTTQVIRISNDVTSLHLAEFTRDFGYTIFAVKSPNWGFPRIPEDVKRAAIITVAANLDRRLDAYNFAPANELVDMDAGVQPPRQMAFSIPLAAMVMLNPYRRQVGAF